MSGCEEELGRECPGLLPFLLGSWLGCWGGLRPLPAGPDQSAPGKLRKGGLPPEELPDPPTPAQCRSVVPGETGVGGGSHGGVPPAAALCPSDPQPPEVKWGASPTALSWQTGTVAPGSLPATPPVSAEPSCKLSFRPAPGSRGGVLVPGWGRRSGPVAAEPPASPLPSPCPRQQGDRTRGCHCASHLLVSAGPAGEPPPRLVPRHI